MALTAERLRMPYYRWEGFYVYENPDGQSYHIMSVDGDGGMVVADCIYQREIADWMCSLMNSALAQSSRS
jgi:hypothetical protein